MNLKVSKDSIYTLTSKKNLCSLVIVIIAFLLDRITKIKIISYQSSNNEIYVNDYLNLELVWNTGIGFGLFNMEANFLYHLISLLILIIIFFVIFIIIKSSNIEKFFYSMILGGAFGNFYDRVSYYAVPDFIDIHYNNFHWFTFNIADIFISVGIILILTRELIKTNEE
jgi:signal peptidase II